MHAKGIETDREMSYQNLTAPQHDLLDNHLKRSRRTMWLNVLARHKGAHLTSDQFEGEYEHLSNRFLDWELVERIDYGERTSKAKCECGASLRYQYIVKNRMTNKISKFGQTCLHNHMGLPEKVVREVIKGIKEIDFERDEILDKIVRGWRLSFDITGIQVSKQIQAQLDVGLPLLYLQESKLYNQVLERQKVLNAQRQKELLARSEARFGGDPFGAKRQPKRPNVQVEEEPYPKADYLHQDTMLEIMSQLISGNSNAGMVNRLLSGLMYAKIHPEQFGRGIVGDAKDAAKAALGVTNDKIVRKWLVEIEYL